jgi:transcriptional regulator
MKIKKQYIIIGLTLSLILIISFFFFKEKKVSLVVPYEQNYTEVEVGSNIETYIKENVSQIKPKALSIKNIKISLAVSDKKYNTEIKEGSSLFELMEKIKEESVEGKIFDFKYKETSGLGNFVTEINGEKGTPGRYWIYYVNGRLGSVGVSNYILKNGDIINWNQEGI